MLAWVLNVDFAGSGVPDEPTVPTVPWVARMQRTSPASWGERWRTTAWIRLRPRPA